MRILVTNDDGIDAVGLHVLARAMVPLGEVVVAAPDHEFSGSGAAVGTMHIETPQVRRASIDGVPAAWAVYGPPALCAMYARLGAFGDEPFDVYVSGINPGANVGRAIYHSGTVGAAMTARNGGTTGIAVSQSVTNWDLIGQPGVVSLEDQQWDTAATVAARAVEAVLANRPQSPLLLNINVPDKPLNELLGWKRTFVTEVTGLGGGISMAADPNQAGHFNVSLNWGERSEPEPDSDAGAVAAGYVSVSWLGQLLAVDPAAADTNPAEAAIAELFE